MAAEGIGALGLDWKAFLFQAINFLILFALLRAFAYPGIVRALDARKRKIDEQLKNAAELERKLAAAREQAKDIIDRSHAQARLVMRDTNIRAEQVLTDTFKRAQQEAEQLTRAAYVQIASDVQAARAQLHHETARMVIAATEKVLGESMTDRKDRSLIERSLV